MNPRRSIRLCAHTLVLFIDVFSLTLVLRIEEIDEVEQRITDAE